MSNRDDPTLNALLNQGIAACRAGDLERARQALIAALKVDPQSETGWLWLSSALTEPAERRACLQRVLAINPDHAAARNGLRWLDEEYPAPAPPAPAAPPARSTDVTAPLHPKQPAPPAEEEETPGWPEAAPEPEAPPAPPPQAEPAFADEETSYETPAFGMGWREAEAAEAEARPDWLEATLQRAEAATPARPAPEGEEAESPGEAATGAEPKPDWLEAALNRAEAATPFPAEDMEAAQAAEAETQPDWLLAALNESQAPHAPTPAHPAEPAEAEAEQAEAEQPDWLLEVNRPAGAGISPFSEPEAEAAEGLPPDWLLEVNRPAAQAEAQTVVEEEAADWPGATFAEAPLAEAPPAPPHFGEAARTRTRPEATACPWCNSPISGLDVTCPTCHRPLEFECPNCNYEVPLDETQCPNCGRPTGDFQQRETYLRDLGEAYLAKGSQQKALTIYRYLAELAPQNAQYHAHLLRIYGQLGQSANSVTAARRVLELEPENPDALDRVGRWYAVQGDFDQLAEIVERLNKLPQRSPRLMLLLGDLEFERRQYPAAFRAYRQAVANPADFDPPTLARLNYRLGEMYLVAEDMLEALHAFQACLATGADIHEVQLARSRIDQIRPPLPPSATRGASETLRAMAGLVLFVWITGVIQVGFRLQNLNVPAVIGLFAAVPGSYLVASAVSTPTAIEWRALLGEKGLTQRPFGAAVRLLGGAILLTAVVLILFGA